MLRQILMRKGEQIAQGLESCKRLVDKEVPIFVGEFGSYSAAANPDDPCRYAEVVYAALGKMQIPNAWWEWDGGFNTFKPGTTDVSDCMRKALDLYNTQK